MTTICIVKFLSYKSSYLKVTHFPIKSSPLLCMGSIYEKISSRVYILFTPRAINDEILDTYQLKSLDGIFGKCFHFEFSYI